MEIDTSEHILNWAAIHLVESKSFAEKMAHEGPIYFQDDSITMHHSNYQKDTRKLLLQRIYGKGKQVTKKWGSKIEIKNENPSDAMELHRETDEALAHTVDDQEMENSRLKQRIVELEASLNPHPLFSNPLQLSNQFKSHQTNN